MTEDFETSELDAQIRRAMQQRSEPTVTFDLAARAMAKAPLLATPMQEINRVRRWNRLFTAIAAILILSLTVWVVENRLHAGGFQSWSFTSLLSSDTTTSSDSTTISDTALTTTDWAFAGAIMAVAGIVVALTFKAISSTNEWISWPEAKKAY
jgi:hypothetical protein